MIGELFVNRKKLMAQLVTVLTNEGKGRRHVFLDGRRLVGKSRLIQEIARSGSCGRTVVVNLEPIVSTPSRFARNMLFQLLGQLTGRRFEPTCSLDELADAADDLPEAGCRAVTALLVELKMAEPKPEALVRDVLDLPQKLAEAYGETLVVAYDHFRSFLNLKTYSELRRIDRIAEDAFQRHDKVHYLISGKGGDCIRQLRSRKSSFWNRKFTYLDVPPLNRYDTYFLASLIFGSEGRPIPRQVLPSVFEYTQGVPFYIEGLCIQTLMQAKLLKEEISQSGLNRAFVLDTLCPGGHVNQACQRVLTESLEAVSGDNSLRAVLQILSVEEGRTLAAIGREMGRPNGQVFGYLKSLLEADLLVQKARRFYYRDPLMRFFVAQGQHNQFLDGSLDRRAVEDIARGYYQNFLVPRPDNDIEAHLRVRVLSSEFEGQTLPGDPFGSGGEVLVPAGASEEQLIDFDNEGSVLSEPAIIASDFLLRGRRRWMVEVKSEDDPLGPDELATILRKRRFFEGRYRMLFDKVWVVAEEGFTYEARKFAKHNRMLISEGADLEKIRKVLKELDRKKRVRTVSCLQASVESVRIPESQGDAPVEPRSTLFSSSS